MKRLLLAVLLLVPGMAQADIYLNCGDTEPTWNVSGATANPMGGRTLFCDDFEDGTYIWGDSQETGGETEPLNDGWRGSFEQNSSPWDPTEYPDRHWARCGGEGSAGTDCTAWNDIQDLDGGGAGVDTGGVEGKHRFAPDYTSSSYSEMYIRYYLWMSSDTSFNHEKLFGIGSTINCNEFGFTDTNDGGSCGAGCLLSTYMNSFSIDPKTPNEWPWAVQNQSVDLPLVMNHWHFVEIHHKLNTNDLTDGVYDLWMDDCGTSGTDCTGTPTLRAHYTNLRYNSTSEDNRAIACLWMLTFSNGSGVGSNRKYDQLVVSTTGPIGFAGEAGPGPSEGSIQGGVLTGGRLQ